MTFDAHAFLFFENVLLWALRLWLSEIINSYLFIYFTIIKNFFSVKQFLQEAKEEFLKKWESPQKVKTYAFFL